MSLTKKNIASIVESANRSLLETSYNRVRHHIEQGSAFAIITSDRHERSGKENRSIYQEMKQNFKNAGFPFTELRGGFKETEETITDPETGETRQVALEEPIQVMENSILVTTHLRGDVEIETTGAELLKFAAQMAQEYSQEAFIFGEPVTNASGQQFQYIRAYDQAGNVVDEPWAGPWTSVATVEKDEDFWSRVKGKYFQLREKKTFQPRSWIEAFKKSRSGKTW